MIGLSYLVGYYLGSMEQYLAESSSPRLDFVLLYANIIWLLHSAIGSLPSFGILTDIDAVGVSEKYIFCKVHVLVILDRNSML